MQGYGRGQSDRAGPDDHDVIAMSVLHGESALPGARVAQQGFGVDHQLENEGEFVAVPIGVGGAEAEGRWRTSPAAVIGPT